SRLQAQDADLASPLHIGTRWRCSVLLCSQARAEPTELPRHGRTHELHRRSIDTLSEGPSSPPAPRRTCLQREREAGLARRIYYSWPFPFTAMGMPQNQGYENRIFRIEKQ